ncbi:hypothetical protein [Stutzerimonas chloritidismutans]|uniref:hypothetical protein n=1 Tax=Stutzerimonas chloritidismutans TaxID=203192 RepID=UPI003F152CD1
MQRPAYLLSTSILIALAALEFNENGVDNAASTATASQLVMPTYISRPALPAAQTINHSQVVAPAQPQRWVF